MSERNPNWNINPVHLTFNALGSSSSHVPVNYLNSQTLSPKTFHSFTALGSSSTHTSTVRSGFQYLNQVFFQIPRVFEEDFNAGDSQQDNITKFIEEDAFINDFTFDGTSRQEEDVTILDTFLPTIISSFEEDVNALDTANKTLYQEEEVPILDTFVATWTKNFTETFNTLDVEANGIIDSAIYSTQLGIQKALFEQGTFVVSGEVYDTQIDATNITVLRSNLSPVTSISALPTGSSATPVISVSGWGVPTLVDPLSGLTVNPYMPTVILGGVTYASNTATEPPSGYNVNANTYFVQWINVAIGSVDSCSLLNFDIQLDRQGGTFSFVTLVDPGYNLGDTIDLFNLFGTVTEKGQIFSNSQVGYLTKGIFGPRNMNKQLNILGVGNAGLFALLTNSLLSTQQENSLGTFQSAAQAIASLAGAGLAWAMPGGDIPLTDFTVQEGETALGALSSLAAQFGGVLLWDGGNNYTIGPPTLTTGFWAVPNQSLITPAGIQYVEKLDLATGIFGTGFFSVPIEKYFDPSIYGLPNTIPTDLYPKVQTVGTCRTPLTAPDPDTGLGGDPLWIIDLPLDTEEVWLQILVGQGTSVIPSGDDTGAQAVTSDSQQWKSLGAPSIAGPTAKLVLKGGALGALVPQAQIGSNLFPNQDAINNGKFIMSVGVTRNNQNALFAAAVASRNSQVQAMLARLIGSFRYVNVYDGSINSFFFGSIPLPGMTGEATVCGNTVQGVIESVGFTFPGLLTVQVSQYVRVNFIQNFYQLDLTSNGGIT